MFNIFKSKKPQETPTTPVLPEALSTEPVLQPLPQPAARQVNLDAPSWFSRLKSGLSKTREVLNTDVTELFSNYGQIDDALYESLETTLLTADVGIAATQSLLENLKRVAKEKKLSDPLLLQEEFNILLVNLLARIAKPLQVESPNPFVIMIVGVNGAGKTTLFKCLLDFCAIQSGRIEIFGVAHVSPPSRAPLAFLPEKFNPPYYLNGREFLRYTLNLHRLTYDTATVNALLAELDLDRASLALPVREYSKGMTQKLGLAACLLTQKKLYVLDEPMTGLDPKARLLLKNKLLALKHSGATVLFSSHSLSDVAALCDKLTVLHEGQVRFTGTPDAFRTAFSAEDLERAFLTCID